MTWQVEFYESSRGTSPAKDFLLGLPAKAQAKLARAMDLLEEYGPAIGEPYVKTLRGAPGLLELRTTLGSDAFRLFFFRAGDRRLVMVHGIRKKTQRISLRDLETARNRMMEYRRRG